MSKLSKRPRELEEESEAEARTNRRLGYSLAWGYSLSTSGYSLSCMWSQARAKRRLGERQAAERTAAVEWAQVCTICTPRYSPPSCRHARTFIPHA